MITRSLLVAAGMLAMCAPAAAKVSADEAAKLGTTLTPVGATKAANKDGSIPEWTPAKKRGALKNEFPSAPDIDGDKALFTINKANMAKYADKLTEGHKELLNRFSTYKMIVYPSRRQVAWPEAVYAATKKNATTAELKSPDEPVNAELGFPFPIPKSGAEPIWNHKLKWRGEAVRRYNNQMIVQTSGDFSLTKIVEEVKFYYASIKEPRKLEPGTEFLRYLSETLAPPRLAGTFILVHEKSSTGNEGRGAWLYSPGLRRIRRAPTVCCDNPYEGTDGHQFYDQVDMFNGVLERYDWKLVGKKEIYIPYNSNKISGKAVKYKDMAAPKHLNQDLPRYELHRVWIVEADNKKGLRHTFKKRRFYIDEDSWTIAAVDDYDHRDELMQFQEGHILTAYNVQSAGTAPEVIYHLNSGRYFTTAMFNEDEPNNFDVDFDDKMFSSSAVSKRTTR